MSAEIMGALPRATHGSADRPLRIGDIEIPCYVLEDGRRVLTQRGVFRALGLSTSGGSGGAHRLARFASVLAAKGCCDSDLPLRTSSPVEFILPAGGRATGFDAVILPDLCHAIIEARVQGALDVRIRDRVTARATALAKAFSAVGIYSLVDEASGYQEVRERDALQAICDRFVAEQRQRWKRIFPDSFFILLFQVKGKDFELRSTPSCVGTWINELVYERFPPGVREELLRIRGESSSKLHQGLNLEHGRPLLERHIASVETAMRFALTSGGSPWQVLIDYLDRWHPIYGETPLLPFAELYDYPAARSAG